MAFGFDDAAIILGSILPSIFKGKKTKQDPQQTPFQLALTQYLTNLAKNKIGGQSDSQRMGYDAVNSISKMFNMGSGDYGQQQQQSVVNPAIANIFRQQPGQRV